MAVAVVSAFINSALTGSTTEPVISHRIASVTAASTLSASGRALGDRGLLVDERGGAAADQHRGGGGDRADPRDRPLGSGRDRIARGAEAELPGIAAQVARRLRRRSRPAPPASRGA